MNAKIEEFSENSNIQVFQTKNFGELRTLKTNEGDIYFSLKDVCSSLGLDQPSRVKSRLKQRGVTSIKVSTPIISQGVDTGKTKPVPMIFIDEPNLYRCIFQSRLKSAEIYQDWVVEEVLPSIRKTGGYLKTSIDDSPETIMAKALVLAQETLTRHTEQISKLSQQNREISQKAEILDVANKELMAENKELAPKAEYTDAVLQSLSTYTMTQIGKELNFESVGKFTSALKSKGIMFRQSGQWLLASKYAGNDYTKTRTFHYPDSKGIERTNTITVWTEMVFVLSIPFESG